MKTGSRLIFSLVVLLLSTGSIVAQTFSNLRKYDITDGISENSVRSIIQDRSGYIWIGTKDGICRFNGQTFQNYGGYPKTSDNNLLDVMKLVLHEDGRRIWVGTVEGLYIFDPFSESFCKTNPDGLINSTINDICYDNEGDLWIASANGLYRHNESKGTIREYKNDGSKGSLTNNVVLSLLLDSSGDIWIGTRDGLSVYNKGLDKFISYSWERNGSIGFTHEINQIIESKDGTIWIGTHYDGVLSFDRISGKFTSHNVQTSNNGNTWIRALHESSDGRIYIGSEDGLFTFNPSNEKIKQISDFSKAVIYSFLEDYEGGMWIGTYFDGIFYIPPQNNNITWHCEIPGENSLSGKAVSQFCEDQNGNIWIATEDEGLNHFNPKTGKFTHYKPESAPGKRCHSNLHALMLDGSKLWIGTFSKGIEILDINSGRIVKRYRFNPLDPSSIPNDHIYSIYKTRAGDIYIGAMKGLCKYDEKNDSFIRLDKFHNTFVYDLIEDVRGNLWIATKNDGVWRMNKDGLKQFCHHPSDAESIGSNHIIRAYIDANENLWFATEGNGICRYDFASETFINYNHTKNLYHHKVFGILDDSNGNLWLSTTYGIVKYNPLTYESRIYTQEDGMQSNQFNYRSSMKASDGKLYFGGINGFNCFYPDQFQTNDVQPNTVIPEITLYKKDSDIELVKPDDKVTITPDVASFDISFECLSFISPSKNRYAYKVEKLHEDWIFTNKPSVSFVDLPAGQYRLYVKSANNDGIWSEEPVHVDFDVQSPLWKTKTAIFIYVLIICLIIYLLIRWYLKENAQRQQQEKFKMEMEMEQESYRSKFQFFTHVAHEIKTPLTLIKAPLDVILEGKECDQHIRENLLIMKQNTDRLLELIKQLLNFRKIDKEGYTISYSNVEANDFISSIVKRFKSTDKNVSIDMRLPGEPFYVTMDAEAVTKILSNLLSNGLKYARSAIIVQVEKLEWEGNMNVVLSVSDDGPGISEDEMEKIFEPFYRSSNATTENGFGIGLSLVKLLVDKLGGTINIGRSEALGGLSVTVMLPQGNTAPSVAKEKNVEKPVAVQVLQQEANLLIVEDSSEMLDFLLKNLGGKFKTYGASNGKEALDILKNSTIDIILSDVMMPQMDGFELLYTIRQDKMLCHIPVVLLSAQGNVNSKIAGLDYGADAYMEKPFSINHLIATIDNLLKTRKLLFERFTSMPNLDYGKGGMKTADAEWLEQLTDIIKNNLTNDQFTVDTLAAEMAVSRSNLRRKVIGVTGLPPNDYIRLVRLKVAAELLQSGKYRVNEVCYLIGFTSHSYFSTCFQKQFGVLPKDYMKS